MDHSVAYIILCFLNPTKNSLGNKYLVSRKYKYNYQYLRCKYKYK